MFNFLQRKKAYDDPLQQPQWQLMRRTMPLLRGLLPGEMAALENAMRGFLMSKHFSGAHDMAITPAMQLTIAAQACLPICQLDADAYADWHGVIVYPAQFLVRDPWTDEAGVVHEEGRTVMGMARSDGPILLSWPDSQHSPQLDGYNVVIHECAHKLDMLNGRANGAPPLHQGMSQQRWADAFGRGFEHLRHRLRHGLPAPIDSYAATDPAEFFAVVSETFFERPHELAEYDPAVYQQLQLFYRQDPRKRLPRPAIEGSLNG